MPFLSASDRPAPLRSGLPRYSGTVTLDRILICAFLSAAVWRCGGVEPPPAFPRNPLEDFELVDLSHAYDDKTIFWPTGKPFRHERTAWGVSDGGYWYSSYDFALSEHAGTHLDAPIHFAEGRPTVGEIPLERLAGPAFVIDVAARCARDPDYAAAAADFESFEAAHRRIPEGAVVLVRTGWGSRWPDVKRYMGDDTPGSADNLHFPGISPDAARLLASRRIHAVGIDTASLDPGTSTDFPAHRIFAAAGIPGLENVANLDALPAAGAAVMALPMKIGEGSGAPCRIAALLPKS